MFSSFVSLIDLMVVHMFCLSFCPAAIRRRYVSTLLEFLSNYVNGTHISVMCFVVEYEISCVRRNAIEES